MYSTTVPSSPHPSGHIRVSGFPDQHLLNAQPDNEPIHLPPLKFTSHPSTPHLSLECVLPPVSPQRHSLRPCQKSVTSFASSLLPNFSPLRSDSTPPHTPKKYDCLKAYSSPVTISSASSAGSAVHAAQADFQGEVFERSMIANEPKAFPIKRSIRTPRGIREVYICPFPNCDRLSSEHSNMKAHLRLHTGERPYVCRVPSCQKSFRWKSSLTYHERALHSNTRPYQCRGCRKSFVERRKLRLHLQLCPAIRALNSETTHCPIAPVHI